MHSETVRSIEVTPPLASIWQERPVSAAVGRIMANRERLIIQPGLFGKIRRSRGG